MSGDFIERGGLWVLGQSALLCAVIPAGPLRWPRWLRQQFPAYAAYERRVRWFAPWIY
jgi:protein-S-isoprenylcysteine O-methyltransferase Ste14